MKPDFAVIFDMDGVMIDNGQFHKKAWEEFCKKHKLKISEKDFNENVWGRINLKVIPYLFGKLAKEQIEEYSEEKEEIYRKIYKQHLAPLKGLISFLDMLKKEKIKRAIATSAPSKNVEFILEGINAKKYFDIIVDDTYVNQGKPHPEIYLKTAEKLRISPKKCIVFEDSLSGIVSAKRAGMKVIGVATTHTKNEMVSIDHVISDFTEIDIEVLKKIAYNNYGLK